MENSLFGLAVSEETETESSPDPLLHSALAQAKSLEHHADLLTRLPLYEHRLNRTLEKAKAELKQLQKERVEAREKALVKAAEIAELKEALRQPWEPHHDGFEFSPEDLTVWMGRTKLQNDALWFWLDGRFPAPPAPLTGSRTKLRKSALPPTEPRGGAFWAGSGLPVAIRKLPSD
jgi:hypothetical protein